MIAAAIEALRAGQTKAAVLRMLLREFRCTRTEAWAVLREAMTLMEN